MSNRVDVQSIESLKEFSGSLRGFAEAAVGSLEAVERESQQVLQALEGLVQQQRARAYRMEDEVRSTEAAQDSRQQEGGDARENPELGTQRHRLNQARENLDSLERDLARARKAYEEFRSQGQRLANLANQHTAHAQASLNRSYAELVNYVVTGTGGSSFGYDPDAGSGTNAFFLGVDTSSLFAVSALRGVGDSERNLSSPAKCTLEGHPVDVATGKVFTDAVDFQLPGPLPLVFGRIWYSTSTYGGPLGHGWHHTYDLGLQEREDAIIVRLGDGRYAAFEHPEFGRPSENPLERLTLARTEDGYVLQAAGGLRYHFGTASYSPGGVTPELPLGSVEDRNGNAIRLVREDGQLRSILDSAGRNLQVKCDEQGRILQVAAPHPENPAGQLVLVSYRYSPEGDLVEVADAGGNPVRFTYKNHLLVKETDRSGMSFYFRYDGESRDARCTRTWGDGELYARTLVYDLDASTTTVTNTRGGKTVYHWNELGLVSRTVDPLGSVHLVEWDRYGNKVAQTDPLGASTRFRYDDAGRLTHVADPLGHTRRIEYDEDGNPAALVDEMGNSWRREFDERGNVAAVIDPEGSTFRYTVDDRGLPVAITDPYGRATTLEWNQSGALVRTVDRVGAETRLEHDSLGRLIRRVDAEGGEMRLDWDGSGRIVQIQDPEGRISRFGYNPAGNLTEATDPLNRTRRYDYGPLGMLERVEDPTGMLTRYLYDAEGDLESVRDAVGRQWRFERDASGRVVEESDFTGRRLRYTYDAAGRLERMENARGQETGLERDALGRLVRRAYADGEEERFAYDSLGRLIATENLAARVEFRYDSAGRVVEEVQNGQAIRSQYDALGNRVERTSPFGRSIRFGYDAEDRLAEVADPLGILLQFENDRLGREVRRALPSGVVSEREYSRAGELLRQRTTGAGGDILLERRYRYDRAGQLEAVEDRTFGTTRFEHDLDGRLRAAIYPEGEVQRYLYDPAGNVPAAPLKEGIRFGGGGISDRPREVEGWTLRYDADGNLIAKENGDQGYQYSYDAAGRLSRVERRDGEVVQFAYDPVGRRVRKATRTRTTAFLWDGDLLLGEWAVGQGADLPPREMGVTASLSTAREYLFRPGSFEPVAVLGEDTALLLETDQIGTPRTALDRSGKIAWVAESSAFGDVWATRGPERIPFRFAGQQEDEETGLYYNRFRYYEPTLRMYISPDPVGLTGGLNSFNYTLSPLAWIDPLGLSCQRVGGGALGSIREQSYSASLVGIPYWVQSFQTLFLGGASPGISAATTLLSGAAGPFIGAAIDMGLYALRLRAGPREKYAPEGFFKYTIQNFDLPTSLLVNWGMQTLLASVNPLAQLNIAFGIAAWFVAPHVAPLLVRFNQWLSRFPTLASD